MKVIFLDIDGVLNTTVMKNPRKLPYVTEKRLVGRFRTLARKTRAHVVLISTWRYDPAGLFSARHHGIPFHDCTPDLPHRPRRDEIMAWLKAHPRVARYAVLDDDDDDLDGLPLFQPNPRQGLTVSLAHAVELFLAGKRTKDRRRSAPVRLVRRAINALRRHPG